MPPSPTINADCGLNSLRNLSNPSASPHYFSPRWRPPCLSCAGRNPLHRPALVNHKDNTLPSPTLLQAAHKCQRPYFSIGMPCLKNKSHRLCQTFLAARFGTPILESSKHKHHCHGEVSGTKPNERKQKHQNREKRRQLPG